MYPLYYFIFLENIYDPSYDISTINIGYAMIKPSFFIVEE